MVNLNPKQFKTLLDKHSSDYDKFRKQYDDRLAYSVTIGPLIVVMCGAISTLLGIMAGI